MSHDKRFRVRVEDIDFAAAHMATWNGEGEPIHGHSYVVAAEVEGSLDEDAWVLDFGVLKKLVKGLCDELDHRFLLQCDSRILKIESTGAHWEVKTPAGKGYVLPSADVVALPIDNSTAERLSEWFCARLWAALEQRGSANIDAITVEISEGPRQRAIHRQERLPLR